MVEVEVDAERAGCFAEWQLRFGLVVDGAVIKTSVQMGRPARGTQTSRRVNLKSGVFLGFVVYRKKRLAPCDVIATLHCVVRNGWGPVVPGVCTVHRLVFTPTVTTLEPHAALCPTIKFLSLRHPVTEKHKQRNNDHDETPRAA